MNRRPLSRSEFTVKDNFTDIYEEYRENFRQRKAFNDGHLPAVIILTGKSGVGKSETALQLFKELDERRMSDRTITDEYLEGKFNCDSPESLVQSLQSFSLQHDLQLPALTNQENTDNVEKIGAIIKDLYEKLKERFPTRIKCLTFDDAESKTSIVRHINDFICKPIASADPALRLHEKWKIIVTTQVEDNREWMSGCDFIKDTNFYAVRVFNLPESKEYFCMVKKLTEQQLKRVHEALDGLPLALKVAREYLLENRLSSNEKHLNRFFDDMYRIDPDMEHPVLTSLYLSLDRLVGSLPHPELAKTLIKMISLLNEKNITEDMITALAEVVITDANGSAQPRTKAHILSNKLVKGLEERFLCERAQTGDMFSLHKLVKQSALLFIRKSVDDEDEEPVDPDGDKRKTYRLTLEAMTRVLPKDGRGHQSHTIYSYLCRHGVTLAGHVDELLEDDNMKRRQTPLSIMLLYSNMLSAMAYCELAQRNPVENAVEILKKALDKFSLMITNREYNDLQIPPDQGDPIDVIKARQLLQACIRQGSPFHDNEEYSYIVKHLSRFKRLTSKDLKNMFDKPKDSGMYLQEGHLNERYYKQLLADNMIAQRVIQEKIYMIEILIEIYFVWVRVPSFSQQADGWLAEAESCAKAALYLCEHVRNQYSVPLMTEVIVERELLSIQLRMEEPDIADILRRYEVLEKVSEDEQRRYGWEYGIRRTDFEKDKYHRLVCKEEQAVCQGLRYDEAVRRDEAGTEEIFEAGQKLFEELLEESSRFNDNQTLSKTHKKHAAFLHKCQKNKSAIRAILDAMYYLNTFLRNDPNAESSEFPEQTNCGKFIALYKVLERYYGDWQRTDPHPRLSTFVTDGDDAHRIDYLLKFYQHYKEHHPEAQADGRSKFQVMEDLIPYDYLSPEDRQYHPDEGAAPSAPVQTMKLTLDEAYSILKLPYGAGPTEVILQYKSVASQHHLSNSLKKFQLASCAYKRITCPSNSDYVDMDMETMKDLFKNIIFGSVDVRNGNGIHDDDSCSSDYSDDEYDSISQQNRQQREQMAKELIGEEEKEKKKAEKRRAKKKKRREKKKLEKEQEHLANNGGGDVKPDTANGIRSSDEGEGIDPNAAFVKKNKKKKADSASASQSKSDITNLVSTSGALSKKQADSSDPGENGNSKGKSRLVANKGNEAAHNGDYPTAIQLFTEAIKLEPTDYRFYGNRSYCYDRIMQFDKALSDADNCIDLATEWPKGYFRKGRALAGLKLFSDAEKSFMQVLKLDRTCEEAAKELTRVRTQQLIDMGFSPKHAEQAVLSKNSLQQALDYLLAGVGAEMGICADDVYVSDDDELAVAESTTLSASTNHHTTSHHQSPQQHVNHLTQGAGGRASRPGAGVAAAGTVKTKHASDGGASVTSDPNLTEEKKMDPTNPEGLTALWVGNVLPTVKETDLQNLFNRYGHVSSVRCLPEKYCAFVNFKSKEAAGKAMNALQNQEVQGQNLLIKFPDNPIATGLPVTKLVKPAPPPQPTPKPEKQHQAPREKPNQLRESAQKVSGPVNGDECYFWRTTGCQFGSKCRWRHNPESKGIDKKPWQRVK